MKPQRSSFDFQLNPVAASVVLVLGHLASGVAFAGAGFGSGSYTVAPLQRSVPTYYANSPSGPAVDLLANTAAPGTPVYDPVSNLPLMKDSGKALRKFVDTLPGIPGLNASTFLSAPSSNVLAPASGLGKVIPIATPEKWVDTNGVTTNDDYYEIAAIEFSEKMHSDLPAATHLRGYVQIVTPGLAAKGITGVPLYQYGTTTPILDAAGNPVFAVAAPSHLGPIIQASSGVPVRVKFTNYLPVGGKLFLPVDTTVTGAGASPALDANGNPIFYTENRAEIHLVGGEAPWISAGSPHQWVAPKGETLAYQARIGKGASNRDVPDMAPAGDGSTTLYFPNKLSARITFFHDRTSGLTRLNTYAGLEAGYLISDDLVDNAAAPTSLVASGVLPADQIPLILEDKTFVPANIAQQDAKWKWGQPGDLWFPHVYETNQDPDAVGGTNPVGRWDYGPWFWPIFPAAAALPEVSFTPEAYHDTPLVNGVAYPTLTVDPKAYRIRVVNASSDRFFNLGWYLADSTATAPVLDRLGNPTYDNAGNQQFFKNTEVRMVPADADVTGAPRVPAVDPTLVAQGALPYDPNCLCQYPNLAKLQDANQFSGPNRAWPTDNRVGGAPDPLTVGPDFIAYGNDGGLLPGVVDIPSQPVTYEANRRSVTVSNVYGYGLMVGPSERADTVVDFSGYAGKTLILYNDAPTPIPFNDQRWDYFSGNEDLTASGGAYATHPGYGPNTRTVMQIVVNATAPAAPFNADALATAVPVAYKASQPAPIVPQSFYNAAFGTSDADVFAHVATGSVAQPTLDFTSSGSFTITGVSMVTSGGTAANGGVGNTVPGSGQGYDPLNPPAVVFNDNGCLLPNATPAVGYATVDPVSFQVTGVTLGFKGQASVPTYSGYTCAPVITFETPVGALVPAPGLGAQANVVTTKMSKIPVQTKAEQELFDYLGRYNSTGGVELPFTNATTQTTIPLSYIDAPTDYIGDNETQIWKIVDNGLWTNSMHFDMVDVQLINRVGWDGTVKVPALNEVGWKDTLRLNPLEDVIVAMRAKHPKVPFGLPRSNRPLDPSVALNQPGSNLGFMVDPGVTVPVTLADGTNTPLSTTVNLMQNFDNEFVWNSAVLSHSENDLMRPIVYQATVTSPAKPVLTGSGTVLRWTDGTPATAATTPGNPANETGFTLTRTLINPNNTYGASVVTSLPANTVKFDDSQRDPAADYFYTVSADNARGSVASSAYVSSLAAPAAPVAPTATIGAGGVVTLSWPAVTGATSYEVHVNGSATVLKSSNGTSTTLSGAAALALGSSYDLSIVAVRKVLTATVKSAQGPATTVSLVTGLSVPGPLSYNAATNVLSWPAATATAPATGITGYSVVDNNVTTTVTGTSYQFTSGGNHSVKVAAVGTVWGAAQVGTYSALQNVAVAAVAKPTGLAFNAVPALTWTALNGVTYTLTQSLNGQAATSVALVGNNQSAPLTFTGAGNGYLYSLVATQNKVASPAATAIKGVAPTLRLNAVTTSSVSLGWSLPGAALGATTYSITRNGVALNRTPTQGGNFAFTLNDTGLASKTSYTYVITPTVAGTAFPSATLTATTN